MSSRRPAIGFLPKFAWIENVKRWWQSSLASGWFACALESFWLPAAGRIVPTRMQHDSGHVPVPRAALRIAFGEMSDILIASQRVFPKVAERSGYVFEHTGLAGALDDLMTSAARSSAA